MKLVCDGTDIADAVLKVSKGISNRTTNPILEGIKLKAEEDILTFTATDLEISIEKTIKANIKVEGEVVVPGKFFSEYIKKLTNEQIELELDTKNILNIKYTDSVGKIQGLNANEFPRIKKLDEFDEIKMTQKELKNIITKIIYAVAVDDNRPILKGCKIEIREDKITAIALDGYRLAMCTKNIISSTKNFDIIVPARALNEISKLLEDKDDVVSIQVQKNFLNIDVDNTCITTRLIDGEFINYKQIIPTTFNSVAVINKNQLEDALERASLLSRIDRNNLVKFELHDKTMILSSKSDIGDIKENLTISLTGNDIIIAFNARYFNEALRVINNEFLKLSFTSSVAPCIITSNDDDDFTFLILPVRIV